MRISFSDIPQNGLHCNVTNTSWISSTGLALQEKPEAKVFVSLVDEQTAKLEGFLKTAISAACSRCGCDLKYEIDTSYTYIFRVGEDSALVEKEVEVIEEDFYTEYIDEPIINIPDVLQEQLILSIPEKLLCRDECKGLCHNCGAALNVEECDCAEDNQDSPFAVLKKLKK